MIQTFCDRCKERIEKLEDVRHITDGYLDYEVCIKCDQDYFLLLERHRKELSEWLTNINRGMAK